MAKEMAENKQSTIVKMFKGAAKQNLEAKSEDYFGYPIELVLSSSRYEGSSAEAKFMGEIEQLQRFAKDDPGKILTEDDCKKVNAAQYPGQTAIEALLGKMYVDITRRSIEAGDLTSLFAREANDPNSDQTVNVNYFYKYIGYMGEVKGTNDSVNLIEQKLGGTDTFTQAIYAVGWKDTLQNMLFNKVHNMVKVNQAAADADTDRRNGAIIGTIVGATYVASQKQAADATAGATLDVKTYYTLQRAIKKIRGLKDPQTGRNIAIPSLSILCNSIDTWQLQRVINGQLQNGGANGTLTTSNMQALPIANIVEYDQGITDGFIYGKDTLSWPGVTAGKCYLFVPSEYLFVMNKRGLTLETGSGSTLQLSTQELAWYRVFGAWFKDFLGSSYPGTSLGAGYGAIIEITLPA